MYYCMSLSPGQDGSRLGQEQMEKVQNNRNKDQCLALLNLVMLGGISTYSEACEDTSKISDLSELCSAEWAWE